MTDQMASPGVARGWMPERWTFVDELPRTGVGKVDKRQVRSAYDDAGFDLVVVVA